MYKFFALFACLFTGVASAQLACNISAPNDTSVCGGTSFGLIATGNLFDVRWSPTTGLSDDQIPNPIANIANSITYIVTNKQVTGNVINNGNFDGGPIGFTNDYIIDCPHTPYGPEIGTWMEGAPNDGQYCVTGPTDFSFSMGGWNACNDHTGNGGNLMYVNGDITTNARIWCQSVTVDPKTEYQFSTWITSVYNGNPAKLAFSINGNQIGSPFTAEQTPCNWNEFFEIWDSGPSTSADICIVNQNTISNGNDFALDDITFQKVCVDTDSVTITVNNYPNVDLGPDEAICPGDSVDIQSGFNNSNIHKWNNGSTQANIKVGKSGPYSVEVTDPNGCVGRDTIIVFPIDTPFAHFPADTTVCFFLTQAMEIRAKDQALKYNWSTGETSQSILITGPGTYTIELENTANCASKDTIVIDEKCEASFLYIPNAFTPNDDGMNEIFYAKGENIYEFNIQVFNRWGEFLFESNNINIGWDGTYMNNEVPTDVYVYKVRWKGVSAVNNKAGDYVKYGHINLIR